MKPFEELTIKDNFMFCAIMMEGDNCKKLLERILEIPIDRVDVDREKSMIYHPRYRGIRLDVYAKDENGTCFNVEMQIRQTNIEKRSRYYHSQIDVESLATGKHYDILPDAYVIFICDYDPFALGKYKYTVKKILTEEPDHQYDDGSHTVILSTKGNNPEEVSPELLSFLKYVEHPDTEPKNQDDYVRELQRSADFIKADREMRGHYMTLEELIEEETEQIRIEIERERARAEAAIEQERARAEAAEIRAEAAETKLKELQGQSG